MSQYGQRTVHNCQAISWVTGLVETVDSVLNMSAWGWKHSIPVFLGNRYSGGESETSQPGARIDWEMVCFLVDEMSGFYNVLYGLWPFGTTLSQKGPEGAPRRETQSVAAVQP